MLIDCGFVSGWTGELMFIMPNVNIMHGGMTSKQVSVF